LNALQDLTLLQSLHIFCFPDVYLRKFSVAYASLVYAVLVLPVLFGTK